MAEPESQTPEEIAGHAIRRFRTDRGLSQRDLADQMTARGIKWSATTCADVERGRRGLLVNELIAVGLVLAVEPRALLAASGPVAVGNVTVADPGLFNLWMLGHPRGPTKLALHEGELVVLQRPEDVKTTSELADLFPEFFKRYES